MIRTTAVPRATAPFRAGVAAASVLGVVALAGCASAAPAAEPGATTGASASSSPASTGSSTGSSTGAASAGAYTDGTYTADGSYQTPESIEKISVTVTLEGDVITAVEVTGDPQKAESKQYQGKFIGGIQSEVVGKNIDEISVSRVAGSSLTSGGFNDAITQIKAEATS